MTMVSTMQAELGLNPEQLEAVEATEGPLLVLAGAGTGKTKVLTSRIGYILQQGLAYPSQILAVTFTNKAAREMRHRIEKIVGADANALWLGTFHSLGAKMLRRHAALVGLKPDFTIIDTDDQIRLLKALIEEHHIDEKRWPAKLLGAYIQRLKDRGISPEKLTANETDDFAHGKLPILYAAYQARLKALSAADFGDLLLHMLTIFNQHKDVLAEYHRRFRYILVDEYQDTNVGQYQWLRLLAQQHKNICCVGDDDQSIYGWRGAEVGNILRFERDFPGAKVVKLERNYRSTPEILATASHLISHNRDRLGKTLHAGQATMQECPKVRLVSLWDEKHEAGYIGEEIEQLGRKEKVSPNEVAILVRAGYQTRAFEECFMSMAIPYKVVGGLRFYERLEIRDILAYLRLIVQPEDDLAFERIINTPKRGIGKSTLDAIRQFARAKDIPLLQAVREMLESKLFKGKGQGMLTLFIDQITRWQAHMNITPSALAEMVLEESGYRTMWKLDKTVEAEGRLENLKELLHALEEFETLPQFLEHVSLITDTDQLDEQKMVTLMTLHAAKGLEFDAVFLPGWEEGLFPSQRSMDEKGAAGLEEERRLAYVGITRARKYLAITFAGNRRVYGQWQTSLPSRFVDELPEEHLDVIKTGTGYGVQSPASVMQNIFSGALPSKKGAQFAVGERVFHQKFGYGRVEDNSGGHVRVAFEKAGTKTLIESFLNKVRD